MQTNHRGFLPAPQGSAVRNTLVAMVGIFVLAWLFYQHTVTDPVQLYGLDISTAKEWVRNKARDPGSVSFENVTVENEDFREIHLTFLWDDGQAGKTAKHWRFDFNKETGRLQYVNDKDTGQMVGYGDEVLAQMRANEVRLEQAKQARTNAALKEAQWNAGNAAAVPGAPPGVGLPVPNSSPKKRSLPQVPGLEGR